MPSGNTTVIVGFLNNRFPALSFIIENILHRLDDDGLVLYLGDLFKRHFTRWVSLAKHTIFCPSLTVLAWVTLAVIAHARVAGDADADNVSAEIAVRVSHLISNFACKSAIISLRSS